MGHLTDLEMRSLQYKMGFSYDFCRDSRLFAYIGFTIDLVTTEHTPKCVENYSDRKVSHICLSNNYQIFCNLGYNSGNSVFSDL